MRVDGSAMSYTETLSEKVTKELTPFAESYYLYFINRSQLRKEIFSYQKIDGWMEELRFYVFFNSISVISGRWADGNEKLCAVEARLGLRRILLERGTNLGSPD